MDGVSTWLFRLVETGFVPARPDPAAEDPAAAAHLHRFVRDVVTANPVSRSALSPVQVYLLEFALECVDWPRLAGDRRLRHLDWPRALLARP